MTLFDTVSDKTIISKFYKLPALPFLGFQSVQTNGSTTDFESSQNNGLSTDSENILNVGSILEFMCLIHSGEPGDLQSAHLCLENVPVVYEDLELDVNSYQGVLGLAHGTSQRASIPRMLVS